MSAQPQPPPGELLAAVIAITEGLDLPEVLRHVAVAAAAQTGAPYAALGVLGPDNLHEAFIHVGMPPDVVAAIGAPPRGHGVLGLITREQALIRVADIAEHPASVGFPANHPPMTSFLGVPLKVGSEVFGNLYLSDKPGGFDADDETVVLALAAAAAVAIHNAQLHSRVRSRSSWLAAAHEITTWLLRGDHEEQALALVVRRAREIATADVAMLVLPSLDGALIVEVADVTDGLSGDAATDTGDVRDLIGLPAPVPTDATPAAQDGASGWIVEDLSAVAGPAYHRWGPAIIATFELGEPTHGQLVIARGRGQPRFGSDDVQTAASFATHAALALRLATARQQANTLAVIDERQRIARDLHDLAVQQLFAAGMQLNRLRQQPQEEGLLHVIDDALSGLDTAVGQIRATITALHGRGHTDLVERLRRVTSHARATLGFAPSFVVDDPSGATARVLTTLDDDLADDLTAVTQEALSNVARHARASAAEVQLVVSGGLLTLSIVDDGVGIDASRQGTTGGADSGIGNGIGNGNDNDNDNGNGNGNGNGLANVVARARRHHGSVTIGEAATGGTRLVWQVPLPQGSALPVGSAP